jgi:hypothetical protein
LRNGLLDIAEIVIRQPNVIGQVFLVRRRYDNGRTTFRTFDPLANGGPVPQPKF